MQTCVELQELPARQPPRQLDRGHHLLRAPCHNGGGGGSGFFRTGLEETEFARRPESPRRRRGVPLHDAQVGILCDSLFITFMGPRLLTSVADDYRSNRLNRLRLLRLS